MWQVEFYTNRNGRQPARDFILEQTPDDQVLIKNDLGNLADLGYQLRRPHAAPLTDGIHELRTKTCTGQFRLFYFFFRKDRIIITHGFIKRQRAVPQSEVNKAIAYRNDYEDQNSGA